MSELHKIRFGFLGCGAVVQKHLDAIAATDAAELVAVADQSRGRVDRVAESAGVPAYTSLEAMLTAHEDIDVVSVLTPSGDHAPSALRVLDQGRHVLIEKPLALTVSDAERVNLTAEQRDRRVFVVKQVRHNAPVAKLRAHFEAGHFGKLTLGTARVRRRRDQQYYDEASWRGTRAMDGGVLANQASHYVDLLQWFLGEPERVYAVGRRALLDIETEDTAACVIEFQGGALGIIEATTATRPSDLEGSFSLLGEKGSVVIGGFSVNDVVTWDFAERTDDAEVRAELARAPTDPYGYGHRRVYHDVCNALQQGRAKVVDGWEALKSLRILSALYESIETGMPVELGRARRPGVVKTAGDAG